jgi:hypothetical protein
MSDSRAIQKAREDLEAVKARLREKLAEGEAQALYAEYNRLCRFIYYRQGRRPTARLDGK